MLCNNEQPNKIAQKKTTIFPSVINYHVLQTITYYVNMPNMWRTAVALNRRTVLRRYRTIGKTFTSSKMNCTMKKVLLFVFMLLSVFAGNTQSSTYTFTNISTDDWNDMTNWTCTGLCPASVPPDNELNIAIILNRTSPGFCDLNVNYTLHESSTLTVASGTTFRITVMRTFTNNGQTVINGVIRSTVNGILNNNGTININAGGALNIRGLNVTNAAGATITNNGTISLTNQPTATLNNNGTINNNANINLSIANSTLNNNAGATLNNNLGGTIGLTGNNTSLINPGTITNNGVINRTGTGNVLNHTGLMQGTGTISGEFINNGTFSPAGSGTIGTFNITGNFTNNGTIIVDIGPGNTSDQINVGNAATLGGTLMVEDIINTGTFDSGMFTIVTATTISGTFMTVEYPNNDPSWNPDYQPAAFVLGYGPMADLLPIELLAFRGKQLGAIIQLHWETATERNNSYVEVQRSRDGKRFEALGRVLGAGNSVTLQRYAFTDEQPLAGVNYYRLRQVDFDGKEEYHRVIAVLFREGKSEGTVQVFPTLAQDQITLALPRELQSPAEVLVSDLSGRVLLRHTLGVGTQQHTLPLAQLASGHYILRIRTDREEQIARFVKE